MSIRKLLGILAGLSIGVPALFSSCGCAVQAKGQMTVGTKALPLVKVIVRELDVEVTSEILEEISLIIRQALDGQVRLTEVELETLLKKVRSNSIPTSDL